MVPVGDQEPAPVGLQRVLDSGWDVNRKSRRMAQGERADVGDDGEAVGAVDSVDADDVAAADVGADNGDQRVRGPADERDVGRAAEADDRLRQTAGEGRDLAGPRIDARDSAGGAFGDVQRATGADGAARATLKAGQQLGGVGGGAGGAAFAADGVIIPTTAATKSRSFRWLPMGTLLLLGWPRMRAATRERSIGVHAEFQLAKTRRRLATMVAPPTSRIVAALPAPIAAEPRSKPSSTVRVTVGAGVLVDSLEPEPARQSSLVTALAAGALKAAIASAAPTAVLRRRLDLDMVPPQW